MTRSDPASRPSPVRRWPLVPTVIVALSVVTMLALGAWQLGRAEEKEALLAVYAANRAQSEPVSLPRMGPVPDSAMFRRTGAMCVEVVGWRVVGGRSTDGQTGYRHIADCRTGAEGPGFVADMGVTQDVAYTPRWPGGRVAGVITREPVEGGLWAALTGRRQVPRAMIVSAAPLPGLGASAPPDPASLPNNHLAYAGQWAFFALAAVVIYVLAVRRRWRDG